MTVKYSNCFSQKNDILTGVPQGSSLGALLFLILFNDITDVIGSANIIKYADDTVIHVADEDSDTIQTELNKVIDNVADWLDENELIINFQKPPLKDSPLWNGKKTGKVKSTFHTVL